MNEKSYNTVSSEYLYLLKRCLTRYIFREKYEDIQSIKFPIVFIQSMLNIAGLKLVKIGKYDQRLRKEGKDWPIDAETMIGLKRLDNIEKCIGLIVENNIPGDLIETGVWRGGAAIFMRAVLKQYNVKNRIVWVADSFKGLPKPDTKNYPLDKDDELWKFSPLAVSLREVKSNFVKYNLMDKQVRFLPGWFKDTLFKSPIKKLSLIRLDGDMYGSTMDALNALYHKLSIGGYLIIDDYSLQNCKAAVNDFRKQHNIRDKIYKIDWTGVYWQRSK